MKMNPDGLFLSNGPGDPEPCTYAVEVARRAIADKVPLFGICLGHQILGLANGAKTKKMKFGHHGANHPVVDLKTKRVYITSQNHGFMVDADTLPANARATHKSLFDGSRTHRSSASRVTLKPAPVRTTSRISLTALF
jgi:carbamoyl-phosphate synthase small subunit